MMTLVQIRSLYDIKHPVGMSVPEGGSNCAKCEYLADNKTDCKNKKFQKWQKAQGVKKYWVIPKKITAYCCDFFHEPEKKIKKAVTKKSTAEMLNLK